MTTETIALESLGQPSQGTWRRAGLGFVAAIGFIVVLLLGFVIGLSFAYEGRVMPGVGVAGTSLAGLDRDQARAQLRAALPPLDAGAVTVTLDGETADLSYAALGRDYDIEAMLDAAFGVGRSGDTADQTVDRVRSLFRGTTVDLIAGYDRAATERRLMILAADLARDPVDASVSLPDGGVFFQATPAVDGRDVDVAVTLAALDPILASTDPAPVSVEMAATPVEPVITTAEAEAAAGRATLLTATDLVLVAGSDRFSISNETLRSWIEFDAGPDGSIVPAIAAGKLDKTMKSIAKKVDRLSTNARYKFRNGRIASIVHSVSGRVLDVAASTAAVQAALAASHTSGEVPEVMLAVTAAKPTFSTADAEVWATKLKPVRRARWTTHFPQGDHNFFGKNISIPTQLISGYVVAPGEWFDFWTVVGEVSRARGFGPGGAIINGRTEPTGALGGGICSCSTTLFNAALRYGLDMGARRNHYYYITRYPLGLDATVFKSGGGAVQSMSFRNDTANPILIQGLNSFGVVTFQLWTVDDGRHVSFTRPVVRNVRVAGNIIQKTTSLKPGHTQQVEYPANGKDVWVTRVVRDRNGKVLHRDTFYSHYARVDGVTLVGVSAE